MPKFAEKNLTKVRAMRPILNTQRRTTPVTNWGWWFVRYDNCRQAPRQTLASFGSNLLLLFSQKRKIMEGDLFLTDNPPEKITAVVDHWIHGTLDQSKARGTIFAQPIPQTFTHNLTLKHQFVERIRDLELRQALRMWYFGQTDQARSALHIYDLIQQAERMEQILEDMSDDDIPDPDEDPDQTE